MGEPENVETIYAQMGTQDLEALRSTVGESPLEIFAPSIEVSNLWCAAQSFSIRLGERYLVIESDWNETPREILNYFTLRVTLSIQPKGIPRTFRDGRWILAEPVSAISLGPPKSPVKAIKILENVEVGKREAVRYDSGLIFGLEDNRRFAVTTRQSILGGLECTIHSEAIEDLFAEWKWIVRTVVE
jgi:hypothetical protein